MNFLKNHLYFLFSIILFFYLYGHKVLQTSLNFLYIRNINKPLKSGIIGIMVEKLVWKYLYLYSDYSYFPVRKNPINPTLTSLGLIDAVLPIRYFYMMNVEFFYCCIAIMYS